MGMCEKLKWNRKRLGLTQKQFADLVGLNVGTIHKLENDETAWLTVRAETEDRICAHFESMASWQPGKKEAEEVIHEVGETEIMLDIVDESNKKPEAEVVHKPVIDDGSLTYKDNETMILMEFAFEGLFDSKRHEEFVANLNIIKRIVNRY